MTARLKSELLVSMLSGRSGEKTARIFQEQFGVNAFCARRIVRTESAYVANAAQKSAYSEAGIDRYRFVATLDSRTCECCAALDGKVFDLAKAKPGTNYPPMHPCSAARPPSRTSATRSLQVWSAGLRIRTGIPLIGPGGYDLRAVEAGAFRERRRGSAYIRRYEEFY